MNFKLHSLAHCALLTGALALAACSGDTIDTDGGGGGGGSDAGGQIKPGADANNMNNGNDAGGMMGGNDATVGGNDGGPTGPCPTDFPGCRCTPAMTGGADAGPQQGSCAVQGTVCAALDDTLAVCVKECMSDTDCMGYTVGNPADNRGANLCRGGICVEAEVQDDELCRLHALAGRRKQACREGATCIRFQDDQPGEGTCLQQCTPSPQEPNGGCPSQLPFCNPRVLSSGNNSIGICTDQQRGVGSRCGGGLTKQCDTSAGQLFCWTNDFLQGGNPVFQSLPMNEGFCAEFCDPSAPACPNTTDTAHPTGECLSLGMGRNGPIGLCSSECDVPNTCTSSGAFGNGTNCFGFPTIGITGNTERAQINLCLDVLSPMVNEAEVINVQGAPRAKPNSMPGDCAGTLMDGETFRCEPGTVCLNIGSQQTRIAGCTRFCTPTSTSAAPPFAVDTCSQTNTSSGSAFCVPFAGSSTAALVGFCAVE